MKSDVTPLYPNEHVASSVTNYSSEHSTPLPAALPAYHALICSSHERSDYMISNLQAQAQIFLARVIGAKRILEVGTFVGYSALGWAHAVGKEGKVVCLEYVGEYAAQARRVCQENGFDDVVEVLEGDAGESLEKLDLSEPFDLIFIDANKSGYPAYLRTILSKSQAGSQGRLLRAGGLIMGDNVLRRGLVADSSEHNPYTNEDMRQRAAYETDADLVALREFNDMTRDEPRLESWLMPLFDGLGLARLID